MAFQRRVLHYSPGPDDLVGTISDRAIAGAWFELHRQGGCGAGELRLRDEFPERHEIELGDWIAFEYAEGDRWYLGRVEQRQADSPAGVTLRLEGMGVQLAEVFPGGFGRGVADGVPPHRYSRTDLFPNDPDYSDETIDSANEVAQVVTLLMQQYVVPRTDISFEANLVEEPAEGSQVTSLKFRGEESARSILKELALRARDTSWGVRADGRFFFLQKRDDVVASFREGVDLISLEETRARDILFNRMLLTGDYVYNAPVNSEVTAPGFYRWRGIYVQPASREEHGERRIRVWVPWVRTQSDAREFTREFFRVYAQPVSRYLVEAGNQPVLPKPWEGRIRIVARDGTELIAGHVATTRVQFDHAPRLRMEIGPEDPRTLWPEPPHDERWEVGAPQGEQITFASSSGTSGSSDSSSESSSDASSGGSSEESSAGSSGASSEESSGAFSEFSSAVSSDGSSEGSNSGSSEHSSELSSGDSSGFVSSGESAESSGTGSESSFSSGGSTNSAASGSDSGLLSGSSVSSISSGIVGSSSDTSDPSSAGTS